MDDTSDGAVGTLDAPADAPQPPAQDPTQALAQGGPTTPLPKDPTKPRPVIMNGAQWSAAQSAPASAMTSGDPDKATTNGTGRTLTGDEWSQAQRMTPGQLSAWKIPAIPAAPRDIVRTPHDPNAPGVHSDLADYAQELYGASVGSVIHHPLQAAGITVGAAILGAPAVLAATVYGVGSAVTQIGLYGYQNYLERDLSPEARKEFEADPEHISSAAAAAQATLLGLGSLVHFGVKGAQGLDFGEGMTEAGAEGVKQSNFAPRFSEGFDAAAERGRFAAQLERGAKAAVVGDVKSPKGFEPTITATRGKAPTATVEGLETPEAAIADNVRPAEGLQPTDLELARAADAERIQRESMQIRRRPGGVKATEEESGTPLFRSPQGANLLGSMAARKGLPDDASPYPASSPLDDAWKAGHNAVTTEPVEPSTVAQEAPPGTVATIDGVRYVKTDVGEFAHEKNPFVTLAPEHIDALVARGEATIGETPSYPEGFAMGGIEGRIPAAPETARGFDLTDEGRAATTSRVTRGGVARSGTTLSDDPRYETGARRPLHLVTVRGLVKEIVDLDEKRADATERAVYRNVQDENFHTTSDGSYVTVATRRGGGVSEQAKALQNLEDYTRIEREVTEHLTNQRGIPADLLDELLDRERQARYDRAAAEPESGDMSFDFGDEETPNRPQSGTVPAPLETVRGAKDVLETTRAEGERRSLERAAHTDHLTGLGNRRAYDAALPDAEADPGTKVIRLDANGFKAINDLLGHLKGDEAIKMIAAAIRSAAPDLPVFRVGGDEFAVFAPADDAETIRDAIEQAVGVQNIEGPHTTTGEPTASRLSISGGVGETNAEADVAAAARKVAHRTAQGIPESRPAQTGLEPLEGTGETRTRGLAAGVAEKALVNRLELGVGELPEYRRLSMADQGKRATQLLEEDPALAGKVARGSAPAPHGLLPESVFVAVEQRAIAQGDVNTLRDLATSRLTSEATTMGQRIRALAERDPDSPVAAIRDVINKRSGGAANADNVAKATTDEVGAIQQHLDAVHVDEPAWRQLIEALRC